MPGWQPLTNICTPTLPAGTAGACGFEALMELISNAMTDLILISTLLVIVALVWSGFNLVTAGMRGDSGALSDLKGKMLNIVIGYAIILGAWLVVYAITSTLLHDGFSLIRN
jgi:hypothetical protein